MAKKKLDKETERTPSSPSKIIAIFKNETVHFVIGLMLVIFSVYLLLAFSSFFFTGAADQSIIDSGNPADLSVVDNHVKNYAGSRGAQLASYLINDCFGISSFFILVFLAVAGLKLMLCTCRTTVEMVYRMYLVVGLVLRFLWICFYGALSGFFHLSGGNARIQCQPLADFSGRCARCVDDSVDNSYLLLYIYQCAHDYLVAQTFCF